MSIACYIQCDTAFHPIAVLLARAGFAFERFVCEKALLRTIRQQDFDLILAEMDVDAPDEQGLFSWLSISTRESTPVVVLSSNHAAGKMVSALEAGADDFIASPFDPVEVVARLNAVLRRCNRTGLRRTIELHGFTLDRQECRFRDRGTLIELTPREFMMAWLFFSSPGVYLSRTTISIAIWGVESEITGRTIEQHVYKLRKKLNLSEDRGLRIRTAYSKGYRLELCRGLAMAA